MSILTKQQLEELNQSSFPDNSTEAITPAILRTYNTATIDTLVDSLDSGSFLTTASFDNGTRNLTFTKGDTTQFSVNIPDASGSILPSGVVSGSSQINYPQISNIPGGIVSGSIQIDYPLISNIPGGIVSGSSQVSYTGLSNIPSGIISSSAQLPAGLVSGSSQINYTQISNVPAGIVSGSSQVILQSTTGNLSGSRIDGTVLLATSASHAILSDTAISASHALVSDTALVAGKSQDLYVNAKNTTGLVISKGSVVRITGASGDNPEVGLADWTNDNSSANSLGIAAEDIPVNGFSDIVVQGKVLGLNTNAFTPGQLIFLGPNGTIVGTVPPPYHEVRLGQVLRQQTNNGSIYLSIDNGYELSELHDVNIITASLANNNLLAWDSASAQWTNKSILGLGIPQLSTNNTFTGTNSFQNISAVSASFQYVQSVTGSATIIGDAFVVVNNNTPIAPYGGLSVYDSGSVTPTTSSLVWDGDTNDWKYSYQVGVGHDAAVMLFGPGGNGLANTPYPGNNKLQKGKGTHHLADSSINDDGTTVGINANLQVTGSISTNGALVLTNTDLAPLNSFTSSQAVVNTNLNAFTASQETKNTTLQSYTASVDSSLSQLNSFTSSQQSINTALNASSASQQISIDNLNSWTSSFVPTNLGPLNSFTASQQTTNTQLLNASSSFEAKFAVIGTQSGSWGGGGGGAGFPFTGSAVITGSLAVTGSINGFVNPLSINASTASLNYNNGNFFTLQLVGGTTTHLTATNIKPGQTINLLVKTDVGSPSNSGSLAFAPSFKFAGGFKYTPTAITGSTDIVSFVSFDSTNIYASQVKNLS